MSELWISAKEWLGQRGQAGRGSEVDAVKIRMLPIQQFSHCTLGNSAHWGFSPLRCAPQFSALLPIRLRSRFSPRNLSAQPGLPSKTQVSQIFTRMLLYPMFMFPEEIFRTCHLQPKLLTLLWASNTLVTQVRHATQKFQCKKNIYIIYTHVVLVYIDWRIFWASYCADKLFVLSNYWNPQVLSPSRPDFWCRSDFGDIQSALCVGHMDWAQRLKSSQPKGPLTRLLFLYGM